MLEIDDMPPYIVNRRTRLRMFRMFPPVISFTNVVVGTKE